ncbi:MAG: VOC family protein [Bacteroidetes bacterium]|nr:VOC family protein [Bacteroidota bacterium]
MFRFYRDVLGLRPLYTDHSDYAFFCLSGDADFQLALYGGRERRGTERNHWFLVIDVEDVESVAAAARSLRSTTGNR